ncbi:LPXTG cell wall anchor domain-containing protein [Corynebacterium diphtheriae]|nr:LPXTG cell wall anchor domain-containing protein [Corynebacterium diphtheriae]CAB0993114.1 LPXTG cell wall anchor domain-containing protein [Corynebacterium diphtheriae]
MKTKFMGVAAALIAALALVFGVAAPGALPSLPVATAQAQDRSFTVPSTQKWPKKDGNRYIPNYKIPTEQLSGGTITFGAGTVVTLESSVKIETATKAADFTVYYTGIDNEWNEVPATYKKISDTKFEVTLQEITVGGAVEIEFKGVHRKVKNTPAISATFDVVGGTTQPEPREWAGSDSHGQFTMRATQGEEPTVTFTRKLDSAGTLSGAVEAWVADQNGYDVDGAKASRLRITGPDGSVIYETNGVPYSDNVTPIQNWAGVKFELPNNLEVQAGTTIEIVSPYGFRPANPVTDPSIKSPIGPGTFNINFEPDPEPPAVEGRHFDAIGHDFAVKADPVDPKKPNTFTATVTEESHMKYATVRIETDATFLDPQKYNLTLDQIEPGVTLQKRNVNIGNGFITMEVVPVKDGKPVDSAVVPKDAVFTFTNNLSQNKNLKVTLDVDGEKKGEPKPPDIISPPDGADWVHWRVPNPSMPQRCGLRIAVVADLSTSLRYADTDGFDASKKAANEIIDSLRGTPAELGIYNFASTGPANGAGTTHGQNPPYISMQSEQGFQKAKDVVKNWSYDANNSDTNWEAGLKQVKDHDYDVVYFITDGMPTTSSTIKSKGIGGEFVQASALNDAIKAANELKAAGTRVVPIMVDLTLGGNTGKDWVVEQDYVLKDIKRIKLSDVVPRQPGVYYKINSGNPRAREANYNDKVHKDNDIESGIFTMVNLQRAAKLAPNGRNRALQVFERMPDGSVKTVTPAIPRWTYGTREVKTMGEDISGTGDTIRVEQYSQLAAQMKKIGEELALRCNGVVKVKKRIVDEKGNVVEDGASGWEFTLSAGRQDIIDPGNGNRVRMSLKATSWANEDRGTASWNIMSEKEQELTLVETQQPGFNLYKRNDKNAVCTETRDGVKKPIEVTNDGEFGFKVKMSEKDKKLSLVSCEVDNYKQPETPPGKLTFKKAQYNGDKIEEIPGLGGATFEIYPSKEGKPDYSAGKLYTIDPEHESIEVKTTGTFFLVETKAPKGLNLLAQPVKFEISVDEKTKKYKISVGSTSSGQIQAKGEGDKMILTVADTTAGELPKTGGYGVGLVGLIGVALAGAGFLLGRRKTA